MCRRQALSAEQSLEEPHERPPDEWKRRISGSGRSTRTVARRSSRKCRGVPLRPCLDRLIRDAERVSKMQRLAVTMPRGTPQAHRRFSLFALHPKSRRGPKAIGRSRPQGQWFQPARARSPTPAVALTPPKSGAHRVAMVSPAVATNKSRLDNGPCVFNLTRSPGRTSRASNTPSCSRRAIS